MKKPIIIVVIIISLVYSHSNAQEFSLGVSAGAILTKPWIANDQGFELYSYMLSYSVNTYIGYKTSGWIGFSAEPGYIRKGGAAGSTGLNGSKYVFNYINMPLLVDFYVVNKLSLSIGLEPALLLSAKYIYDGGKIDAFWDYEDFELSGLIGMIYRPLDFLDIGFRYSIGITYLSEIEYTTIGGDPAGNSKTFNQYFQLFLRYRFLTREKK